MTTPLRFMTATVLGRRMVTPGMVRITLGGEGLTDLTSTGVGDEYIRLFFPHPATGELVLPAVNERGQWVYPEGKKPSHCECYTIRYARPGEIDVDFVVHEGGVANDWAQRCTVGQTITIREPFGIYSAPADADWQLFVCDATGLPALGRLLENLRPGTVARAIVEVPDASHEQAFDTRATLKTIWLHGSGNGVAPSRLGDTVRAIGFPQLRQKYVWVACETKTARGIRKYLRHELGWAAANYSVTNYWTEKQDQWNATWEALSPDLRKQIDELWLADRDREEIADEYEARLESLGL